MRLRTACIIASGVVVIPFAIVGSMFVAAYEIARDELLNRTRTHPPSSRP